MLLAFGSIPKDDIEKVVEICLLSETAGCFHPGEIFLVVVKKLIGFLKFVFLLTQYLMIIVHDTFICKPGNASKLAKLFKEQMSGQKEFVNIMTDMTGQYNKVVMVSKFDSLTAYENSWKEMENSEQMKKMQEAMKGYTEMYLTGSREIFQVW
jgi:hypothetical protein